MPGYRSSGFEIDNVFDRRAYPVARPRRTGPPSPSAEPPVPGEPPAPAPPVTRIVNFAITVTPNTRSTRFFGPLRGPGIIKRVRTISAPVAANSDFFFFPSYNDGPIDEQLIPVGTAYSWPTLWQRMPIQGADFAAPTRGLTNNTGLTQKIDWDMVVDGVVPLREWYLLMTVGVTGGAANQDWSGYVVCLEGVDPAVAAAYVG